MMALTDEIKALVDQMYLEMVKRRRDLHRYPEPGWTEFRTASFVASTLMKLGYDVKIGKEVMDPGQVMGQPPKEVLEAAQKRAISEGADPKLVHRMDGGLTGVMGIFHFGEGPVVGMRFDLDSNDVTETTDPDHFENKNGFRSLHEGAMHACGHDGHITVGLAVAEILIHFKDQLHGTIKLIFQPAEEGVRGAKCMVEKGIVDDVDFMLGSHFGIKLPKTGYIATNVTGFLATTKYDATFAGQSAHAGVEPQKGRNALLAACCASLNLHAIARNSEGTTRINVGKLTAGSARNAIPDKAVMLLETRGGNSKLNQYMSDNAKRILKAAADMYDVTLDLKQAGGASGFSNTPALAAYLANKAKSLGIFKEVVPHCDFGASEDCSYFLERVQDHGGMGAYCLIGADLAAGHHDPRFNFDENAMKLSAIFQSASAIGLMNGEYKKN